MDAICVEKKQTLSPLICVFVCRARIAANIPSKRQQASKTPAHRTRLNQKMWTEKLYDGMVISHPPFRPFSHQIFILKDSFLQKLCIYPVWEKKSENLKQHKTKWWTLKWRRWLEEISRTPFVWRPSPVRIVTAHLLRRLPELWKPVGNLRAAMLIFAIHIYNRKDDLDLNPSGQSQWLTGCKRLWTVFLARPVLNQMAAEMGKCCHLQALSPSNGHVPLDIVFLQFDFYSWFCLEIYIG
jgi:hypothetical protein